MALTERDVQRLREYREELGEAERSLAYYEREVEALRKIVAGLEQRVQQAAGAAQSTPDSESPADEAPGAAQRTPSAGPRTDDEAPEDGAEASVLLARHHGAPAAPRRGLKEKLREIMGDGVRRDVGTAMEEVLADPRFQDPPPARNTISNRLYDLAQEGYLRRVKKGVYELASDEAEKNGPVHRVQTGGPPPAQKPPGEEVAPPRPGHPVHGGESAKVASRLHTPGGRP